MKKALALVLALVLALSMAVSAFALDLVLVPTQPNENIEFVDTVFDSATTNEKVFLTQNYYGGEFYTLLAHEGEAANLADIKIVTSGNVTAELIDYNPETMSDKVNGNVVITYSVEKYIGTKTTAGRYDVDEKGNRYWTAEEIACFLEAAKELNENKGEKTTYKTAVKFADYMNKALDTTEFRVVADNNLYVVKFTVADNFSASYTEGTVTVTATCKNCDKAVYAKLLVINDVSIFKYESVKSAAQYYADGEYLAVSDLGYSDWATAYYGYESPELSAYNYYHAEVISTTAFRAIEGKNVVVAADNGLTVVIKDVAKAQKGVNFLSYGDNALTSEIEFGFEGKQVVASDFAVVVDLGYTYFELREHFLEKIEEDDIVDFYLTKDGKVIDTITVDFMTVDYNEEFELVINGKNTTLGQYTLDIAAPVAAEGEENPNTGAEAVVGVVAALAVVSVATAAAVSLKK